MRNASRLQRRPVLESLEGRLVLSAAPAAHVAVGHAHVHHLAKHAHSPIIAHLSPVQTAFDITSATFDRRSKVITIKGTFVVPSPSSSYVYFPGAYGSAAPPYTGATTMNVSANVSQATDRRGSIFASAQTENVNSAVGQKTSFTLEMAADAGRFARGNAVVSLSVYIQTIYVDLGGGYYNSYFYNYPSASAKMVVKLSPGRAS